jgi:hypothetical protein
MSAQDRLSQYLEQASKTKKTFLTDANEVGFIKDAINHHLEHVKHHEEKLEELQNKVQELGANKFWSSMEKMYKDNIEWHKTKAKELEEKYLNPKDR